MGNGGLIWDGGARLLDVAGAGSPAGHGVHNAEGSDDFLCDPAGKLREDGEWRLAARYDTCHGRPHLDVVNEKGELVLKRWMEERSIGEAFQQALLDFKKNHEKYE